MVLVVRAFRQQICSSDGRVVRAPAMGAVDFGLIPSRVKPMTSQLVFTASLRGRKMAGKWQLL